jgi:hypothetical protein
VELKDHPRPLALYEMVHPRGTPHAGDVHRIIVFQARLLGPPRNLPEGEVLAVISLAREQVVRGPERKPTLGQLIEEGARIVAQAAPFDQALRLYPLGTASALAKVLRLVTGRE